MVLRRYLCGRRLCLEGLTWMVFLSLCVAVYYSLDPPDVRTSVEEVTLPARWMLSDQLTQRLDHRRHHLQKMCKKYGLDVSTPVNHIWSAGFVVSREHSLVWCPVYKAASSTWLWNFNLLAGYTQADLLDNIHRPLPMAREKNKLLVDRKNYRQTVRTMKSRHPELGATGPWGWLESLPLHIGIPTFRQFVQYLLERYAKHLPLNEHWIPATSYCTPCLINYTVLAKVETLEEDAKYIIFTSGIQGIVAPRVINRSQDGATSDLADHYLCQLSHDQMTKLIDLYKYDILLFEYDIQRYLDCTANK
ncbi:Carbohydrate sulfotransferase 8-like 4 [Homarus americanus]|uniref:Carbohydrate sulfotransferase n=1 Tax=Homarus americanus TaxID=6706 RepID=A0A8J5ND58_HOMAM|nr:Carbohydrate sulfotransferase 8-like 4 [Homarus americanus]